MDNPLEKYFKLVTCKGIIHVGGHLGEEADFYKSLTSKVMWIEPIPEYANTLRDKGYDVREYAICNSEGRVNLNVCSNTQFSSTLLPIERETKDYFQTQAKVVRKIEVNSLPLRKLQTPEYNVLLVDVQGGELEVLKSAELNFDLILVECSDVIRYQGSAQTKDIVDYLKQLGYERVDEGYLHGNKEAVDIAFKKIDSFGRGIDSLIYTNIAIWHKDTLVRNGAIIPLEEKAKLFLDARILNSERNFLRDRVDSQVGQSNYSTKINYYGERK